jgi:DNA-binding GntR family transcriptional regulator
VPLKHAHAGPVYFEYVHRQEVPKMTAETVDRATDALPRRERVAAELRQMIADGELKPGDTLESEITLGERFGVSRHTIREALSDLTTEGLLSSGRGRGRQVRAYRTLDWQLSLYESRHLHEEGGGQDDQWAAGVRALGRAPDEAVDVGIVEPPLHVAELLGVEPDELVVVRRRVRLVDGVPFQLANSYFRESLVRGTALMAPRSVSAPGGLLASIGHPQDRYRDEIRVRMPSKDESGRLDLPKGTPVAEVTRTGYAEDGTPLRVMVTVAAGDRNVLVYDLAAK